MQAVVNTFYQGANFVVNPGEIFVVWSLTNIIADPGFPNGLYEGTFHGTFGTVPVDFVDIRPQTFYVGRVSREAANIFLREQSRGKFIIRDSSSTPGLLFEITECSKHCFLMFLPDSNGEGSSYASKYPK